MSNSNQGFKARDHSPTLLGVGLAIALITFIYLWFVSSGHWTNWRSTSAFYNLLADGFRHGQVSLMIKPDPRLLTLANPYDPSARTGIPYPIDVSLYQNKYFLYFGPLPGVIIAALYGFFPQGVADQYLVFSFTLGVFFFQSLLLLNLRRIFFSSLPGWMDILGVLMAGLLGPFTRLLVHPYIYEAALAGGGFFFTVGLYFTILAVEAKPIKSLWLLSAGIAFVFSIGTRIMQLFPIAFIGTMIAFYLVREAGRTKTRSALLKPMIALIVPLALGGACLAWYNWIRFGSIFEFGLYYQLAYNLQSFYHALFLPGYIPQNLYNYLLNPFTLSRSFPFLNPLPGNKTPIFALYDLPQPYIVDGYITGLVFSSPFILFSLLPPCLLVIQSIRKRAARIGLENENGGELFHWILLTLAGSCLSAAVPVMLFFYAATRYEVDFFSPLFILAVIGFWEAYFLLVNHTKALKWIAAAGVIAAVLSMALNTLIAFFSHLTWFGIN
jgi:hypothetical protein